MNRKRITAQQFMQLQADPQWRAEQDAHELRLRERARQTEEDEAILLNDLTAVGIRVASVYDFVNSPPAPLEAIPVLVRHLGIPHLQSVREGIIRALTIPAARPYALSPLIEHFRSENDPNLKWVIANALSAMATSAELAGVDGIVDYLHLFQERDRR